MKVFPSDALVFKNVLKIVIEISNFYDITESTLYVKYEITTIIIKRGSTENGRK